MLSKKMLQLREEMNNAVKLREEMKREGKRRNVEMSGTLSEIQKIMGEKYLNYK